MKKLTTLFAAALLGSAAASAAPVDAIQPMQNFHVTSEGAQKIRTLQAQHRLMMENGQISADENVATRSWIDRSGNIWDLSVLLSTEKICDMVQFTDANGNPVSYGFDVLPYYYADYMITMRNATDGAYSTMVTFSMCWPSYYVWEQVWTYTGELEDGTIPEANRNYAPVSMDDLANNAQFTQVFKESDQITGPDVPGTTTFEYWTLLPNSMNESGGYCMYNGSTDYTTYITAALASQLKFSSFDPATRAIKCDERIYIQSLVNENQKYNIRNTYDGTARIEGFEEIDEELPAFGDMHLYNAGLGSSAILGDANPYTAEWGPYTMFYLAIGGEKVLWDIDNSSKPFTTSVIANGGVDTTDLTEVDALANAIWGYAYADPKYANDTTLDPETMEFYVVTPEVAYDDELQMEYFKEAPVLNSFTPYGYQEAGGAMIGWSEDYSVICMAKNNVEIPVAGSRFGWGMTDGFHLEYYTMYKKHLTATGTGVINYHYDPKDVSKIRVLNCVGDGVWGSGVETVAAAEAQVSAANGVISVVAAEAGNVAVYTLDGACVKSVKAAAGQTVNVAADKGLYVVVVNGTSKKVML